MSSEYPTEEERERLRNALALLENKPPFAVVAFVQRGVAEWRRVSRYRGEARDVETERDRSQILVWSE